MMDEIGINVIQKVLLEEICTQCYHKHVFVECFWQNEVKIVCYLESGRFYIYHIPITGTDDQDKLILGEKSIVLFAMSSSRYYKGIVLPKIEEVDNV